MRLHGFSAEGCLLASYLVRLCKSEWLAVAGPLSVACATWLYVSWPRWGAAATCQPLPVEHLAQQADGADVAWLAPRGCLQLQPDLEQLGGDRDHRLAQPREAPCRPSTPPAQPGGHRQATRHCPPVSELQLAAQMLLAACRW